MGVEPPGSWDFLSQWISFNALPLGKKTSKNNFLKLILKSQKKIPGITPFLISSNALPLGKKISKNIVQGSFFQGIIFFLEWWSAIQPEVLLWGFRSLCPVTKWLLPLGVLEIYYQIMKTLVILNCTLNIYTSG